MVRSQFLLALALINGKGVERNEADGLSWLRKAAGRGYTLAQRYLGSLYETDRGVPARSCRSRQMV
jgi:TPR repeat protein